MAFSYKEQTYGSVTLRSSRYFDIDYSTLDYTPLHSTTQLEADKYVSDVGDTFKVTVGVTELDRTASGNSTLWVVEPTSDRVSIDTQHSAFTALNVDNSTLIRLTRVSKKDAPYVDYANAAVLTEQDLDAQAKQSLHIAQESIDTANDGLTKDTDGKWNAGNAAIKNVGTPSVSTDVATKGYVDGTSTAATVAAISDDITTVAGVSDDVTTVAGAVKETIAYTVSASGGKFYIQGGEFASATSNPVLNLQRGSTYTFDYTHSSILSGSHVLAFSTADTNTNNNNASAYTDGINDNTTSKVITFVVPSSAPDTLYYYCTAHPAMGNTMNIAEDSIEVVADNIANVNLLGPKATEIGNLGTSANVTNMATLGASGVVDNIATVADSTYKAKVETVADSAYKAKVETVADSTYKAKVETVAGDTTAINSIHTNISQVTTFADTYHPAGTTEPSGSNVTEGDLWYDTANDVLKVYDGSSWASASSSIATVASQNEFTASDGQGTGNKYFALNHDVGLELVFLNGVRLKRGSDYYCTNSNTSTTPIASGNAATFVRLETVPGSSDILSVMAFGQIANNLAVNTAGGTFTGGVTFEAGTTHNLTSNNTSFTLPTTRGTDAYVLTRDDSVGTGGTAWKQTITAPTITNVTGEINEDTNTTLTVTGNNFDSGMTLKLIYSSTGADITGHTSLSYSGSSSPLTVTIPSATTNITAGTQVKLHISKQGLTTQSSAITVSEDPNWTTNAGNLAEIYDHLNAGGTTPTVFDRLTATAGAGGGTLIYTNDDSSLDSTYFSIASSTGIITTTATALTGLTGSGDFTENFNANAKIDGDTTKNTVRAFNIIIKKSYTYATDILVVGGGGGSSRGTGSGGSGGGGMVYSNSPINLTRGIQYTVEVGTGGASATSANTVGSSGNDSIFGGSGIVTVTAKGGGYGAKNDGSSSGDADDGGSGGGAGGASVNGSNRAHGVSTQGTFTGYTSKGNSGGTTTGNTSYIGSGGGGAGAVGGNSTTGGFGAAGNGGAGYQWSIDGVTYAGGGGGGTESSTSSHRGLGGPGGGGNGGFLSNGPLGGTDGLGGGAGGSGATQAGGSGGNGIIKLKINLANHTPTITKSSGVTLTEDTSTYSGFNMVTISVAGSSQWIKFT